MSEGKENKIQSAIAGALQVYCRKRNLVIFPPYANQQGKRLRQYCGDLLAVLDDADLIALEIKELHVDSKTLKAFDADQHKVAKRFEEIGVPLAYAYNAVQVLPYNINRQPDDWDIQTLQNIKRSPPSFLPGPIPDADHHQSLLEWLNGKHTKFGSELFGQVHGAINAVDHLRNGILVLLYSQNNLALLDAKQIDWIVNTLSKSSWLNQRQSDQLESILGKSKSVIDEFFSPKPDGSQVMNKRPKLNK